MLQAPKNQAIRKGEQINHCHARPPVTLPKPLHINAAVTVSKRLPPVGILKNHGTGLKFRSYSLAVIERPGSTEKR
jgi:hypothetical protein